MPAGYGGAWPGFETTRRATHQRPGAAGVEGAGGTGGHGCGARGRRQGQSKHTRLRPRPIGGRRGACGAWPGFETTRRAELAARTARGRAGHAAAGPDGAQNTNGQANRPYSPPPPGSGRPV